MSTLQLSIRAESIVRTRITKIGKGISEGVNAVTEGARAAGEDAGDVVAGDGDGGGDGDHSEEGEELVLGGEEGRGGLSQDAGRGIVTAVLRPLLGGGGHGRSW